MDNFILSTERLVLRKMNRDDMESLLKIFADHEAMKYYPSTKNEKQTIDWIEWTINNYAKHGLELSVKSNLIFSVGNSFQHFLTNDDQDGLLTSINKHLETKGIFIFGTRFPTAEELLQPNTEEYWKTYTDKETHHKVDVYTISRYESLNQVQHYTTIRRYKDQIGEIVKEVKTNISLRYVFPVIYNNR